MENIKLTVNKDVLKKDHRWLSQEFRKGDLVIMYLEFTYGCISKKGVACTTNGKLPFFEIPATALSFTYEGKEFGIFMKERGWDYSIFYCKEFPMDTMELLSKIQSTIESAEEKPITTEQRKENEVLKVRVQDKEVTYEIIQLQSITKLF